MICSTKNRRKINQRKIVAAAAVTNAAKVGGGGARELDKIIGRRDLLHNNLARM